MGRLSVARAHKSLPRWRNGLHDVGSSTRGTSQAFSTAVTELGRGHHRPHVAGDFPFISYDRFLLWVAGTDPQAWPRAWRWGTPRGLADARAGATALAIVGPFHALPTPRVKRPGAGSPALRERGLTVGANRDGGAGRLSGPVRQRFVILRLGQGGPVAGAAANGSTGSSPMKKPSISWTASRPSCHQFKVLPGFLSCS